MLGLAGLLCLAPGPRLPVAAASAPAAELMIVSTVGQAQVAEARMRAGYFLDHLLLPGARYMGRIALPDLDPALRAKLEPAGAGVPVRMARAEGGFLVAQIVPGTPALLGQDRFAQDTSALRAIVSVGPTNLDLLGQEVEADGEDLSAVCRATTAFIDRERQAAQAAVAALPAGAPLLDIVPARARLGSILSFTGDIAGAIAAFEALDPLLPPDPPPGAARHYRGLLDQMLGILHLRQGEQDNCLLHHNREMCLFPLSAKARHHAGEGARRSVERFTRYLQREPENLDVRWLLNVAAMTVGAYPDGVPERHRIGPAAFQSAEDPGRFWDVAASAGLGRVDNAGGSVADDFDGDGLLDVVMSSRDPCEPLRFFRSRGDGTFADETEKAGLRGQLGGLNVTQTDYDNDGKLDLFVMRGGWEIAVRNSLLRGNGDGTFTDVSAAAGLSGVPHRTHSAAWADFDGDGWLDVFVGHELSFSQLFRNRGDGTFEDVTERAGLRFRSLTKGATWGDIDNDGRPDLYVSNFGERNLLFHNLGGGRFEEVGRERGVSEPQYSFTTWFWDYDNDGWQDLLVVSFLQSVDEVAREYLGRPPSGETLRVYHNRGDGTFEDATQALGLGRMIPTMGANFGDLDNDGWLDFYLGTGAPSYGMLVPNRMFRNRGGRAFVDVTQATGTGHLQKGHGVSFADLDNDGDEDVLHNVGGAFPGDKYPDALFENPGHGNDWLAVRLVGVRANRAAIGARLRVVLEEGGREAQRVRWVTSGGSFGASPLLQHVGLGRGARLKRVEIAWPGQPTPQVVDGLPTNRFVEITEGRSGFRLLERRPLPLGGLPGRKEKEIE